MWRVKNKKTAVLWMIVVAALPVLGITLLQCTDKEEVVEDVQSGAEMLSSTLEVYEKPTVEVAGAVVNEEEKEVALILKIKVDGREFMSVVPLKVKEIVKDIEYLEEEKE